MSVLNEPFPGASWTAVLEGDRLPRARAAAVRGRSTPKVTAAIRPRQAGSSCSWSRSCSSTSAWPPPSLPASTTGNGLSFHSYAVDAGRRGRRWWDFAVETPPSATRASGDRHGVRCDDLGADAAAPHLRASTAASCPWMFWAYNESVHRRPRPAGRGSRTSRAPTGSAALVRPYPVALAGTPEQLAYDPATRALDLRYSTLSPSGRRSGWWLPSVVTSRASPTPRGTRCRRMAPGWSHAGAASGSC